MKTGSRGRAWVQLDKATKPPPVGDVMQYWASAPPEGVVSPRCLWWARQILNGWRPNRRWRREGYHSRAEWLGVWIWELQHIIEPLIGRLERLPVTCPAWDGGALMEWCGQPTREDVYEGFWCACERFGAPR